ncbi:hypothetical protein [Acidisphaera sp. S103]|uniref:hypothetical protein n=1 Tax=Acidisphaera sp. S103 TaxID=1747223 RepID=UPI00131CDE87|nr:hypothetical protein [Acidisphaera sp. S103]
MVKIPHITAACKNNRSAGAVPEVEDDNTDDDPRGSFALRSTTETASSNDPPQ